ncbi:M20/M25/M40 family metallo-hydrolase [Flagellimonas taeanensis]|uniref:M20/M25/M40 family metallo-hydrolase n=1 Tax=Flavobacteriaceae TaxID=49546 RepID=UPI000E690C1A|nr:MULTISPECIES: M20/M25/M40 family metallo-hydrolase [Allomuricauda]MDC6384405.1 M20/M25/M40 family metallo-hydrolase [Muricauda sp. SK9]RIV49753.1 M20/M25/M40 family metallo-hydrolase [Allomuricauda taeanensis]RIV53952.1 M20/M25/M40 family metallo-hydrolase [Allomuricauda taeanensis]
MRKIISFLSLILSFSLFAQDDVAVKSQVADAINELQEFIAIPNDALNPDDIDRNIMWLKRKFGERGFNTAVLDTDGLPLFFAATPVDNEKPTVLIYMHLDGQSVDPSKWDQPDPYKMVLKMPEGDSFTTVPFDELGEDINYDWRLFGRSTSDDKSPIVTLLNTFDLLKNDGKDIPFNVKVILDSEEEKSSKPLPKAVKQYRELLEADFLMIVDGPVHATGVPTIVYGCRGITTLSLTTYGPIKPQHSGHYGNYAPNPGFQLAQLLASMKDADGKVTIPGYYDGITLDEATKEILKSVPDSDEEIAEKLQFRSAEKVGGFYQEALQYPSLNIRGLGSGWIGEKARTIVPESATAELDLRLVVETDGNRLKKLVKDHIAQQGFKVLDHEPSKEERMQYDKIVTVKEGSVTDAFRTELDNPYGLFLTETLKNTFGSNVVQIRTMGGTVPIAPFINELKIPAFIVPMVNPDNNQHSPNENVKIGQLAYGIKMFYGILSTPKS